MSHGPASRAFFILTLRSETRLRRVNVIARVLAKFSTYTKTAYRFWILPVSLQRASYNNRP